MPITEKKLFLSLDFPVEAYQNKTTAKRYRLFQSGKADSNKIARYDRPTGSIRNAIPETLCQRGIEQPNNDINGCSASNQKR